MSDGSRASESVVQLAARLAAERKVETERRTRLDSGEALQVVRAELDELVRLLEGQGQQVGAQAGMPARLERGPHQTWAVVLGPVSTTVKWDQRYSDTIRDAALVVKGWNRVHSFSAYATDGEQSPASERWFELDLIGDQWVWREATRGERAEQFSTTEALADAILRELIMRAFTPPEQREGYRPMRR